MCDNTSMRSTPIFLGIVFFLSVVFFATPVLADEIISITATVPGVTGGGSSGGGGGGGYSAPTGITFSGRAYPLSRVTILRDGQIAITTIAGPDAVFTATLQNLSSGNYTFTVYSEDSAGRRSTVFSFPLYITSGATTDVSGIFVAPTIDVDKAQVKQGENISIFGIASPSSAIVISVHSAIEQFLHTQTDQNGVYLYTYDTSPLEIGVHETKSKAVLGAAASEYGKVVSFQVGDKTTTKPTNCVTGGDLNGDCRVNLVDFSIMAFWYKKTNAPLKVDLNGDGKISIIDFSILAYYWTG